MMALLRGLSILLFLLLWQGIAYSLQDPLLPTPVMVWQKFVWHVTTGELLYHLSVTLMRVAIIFTIAMLLGTLIGVLMGHFPQIDAFLDGLLVLALNIPALVVVILCYIWLGLTDIAAVAAVVINKVPTVVVTVREGARAIDRRLMQVADVFKVSLFWKLSWVYLPQLSPYLMAAARSGLSLIWKIVLVVELLGRSSGMGFQLGVFFQFFDITSILAYTFAFVIVVFLIEALFMRPLERYLHRWRIVP
ncbi:ABC transporter permease [Thioflexithrix psekupsensis]|uniref:ABC transporter permease n=1 Tax=Thioflexithrix psekupsensis TaxID=1570016 RepID=A0A251XBL7_9GAMM|nr:ABC transporter permease subunit [Thioflexithrix psekupsensis]OUD15724.1 ABC transporter permease [Thioflexithrix psekupsensis]